ncbi:hypothetical protein BDV93DRAFT_610949 [Ceratobasidium sp. AG-I]|nr:hypothetical protein BDV93DRAFT_610949 [Ceratobasidium sp. AG-I]
MNSTGPVDCSWPNSELYSDAQHNPSVVCLSTGAVVGLSFQAQSALLSLAALLILVGVIVRNYRRNVVNLPAGSWKMIRSNMDILMLNLIFSDIMMALGSAPSAYWASQRQVYVGSVCNAQGAMQTIGETAVALSTLAVTMYTFVAIRSNRRLPYKPRFCLAVVGIIWLWVFLWAIVPLAVLAGKGPDEHGAQVWYTPTPWWCWINGRYMSLRIVAEYLWLWIAGVGTIFLYIPTYLMLRKNQSEARANASKMLYYPLAYTSCVLPLSIMRWAGFVNPALLSEPKMNGPAMVFGATFSLMGFIDVALILYTRPGVLLIGSDGRVNPKDTDGASVVEVSMDRISSRVDDEQSNNRLSDLGTPQKTNHFGGVNVSMLRYT